VILPHSESFENEGDEVGNDPEDEIERIGQAEAEEDPEVLAGLIELSHLCEWLSPGGLRSNFNAALNADPAEVGVEDVGDLEFPYDDDENALPDLEEVVLGDPHDISLIDPGKLTPLNFASREC
jgi:hypothetical protein